MNRSFSYVLCATLLIAAGMLNAQYVFAVAALLIFGFLAIGFLLFPKLRAVVPFSLGPIGPSNGKEKAVLLSGTEVLPSEFPQHFTCVFRIRSWLLLLALAVLSISAFCLLVAKSPYADLIEHSSFLGSYAWALATITAVWISSKWYSEQSLLARSLITIGTVTGVNELDRNRELRYEFRDSEGGYFGGTQRDFVARKVDNVVFVLYDKSNPDKNSSSRGFMFRSFTVYPARQAAEEGIE